MFDRLFEKDVAISGIGQSEVGRPSGLSAMQLTLDAALEAIADAGLSRDDIDLHRHHVGQRELGRAVFAQTADGIGATLMTMAHDLQFTPACRLRRGELVWRRRTLAGEAEVGAMRGIGDQRHDVV